MIYRCSSGRLQSGNSIDADAAGVLFSTDGQIWHDQWALVHSVCCDFAAPGAQLLAQLAQDTSHLFTLRVRARSKRNSKVWGQLRLFHALGHSSQVRGRELPRSSSRLIPCFFDQRAVSCPVHAAPPL